MAAGVILIILGTAIFRDMSFPFGGVPNFGLLAPGIFVTFFSIVILVLGFRPNIVKLGTKLQNETLGAGEDISQVTERMVDTISPAITKTARAIKDGIVSRVYCKHCGKQIDADSKFCKYCAKEQ